MTDIACIDLGATNSLIGVHGGLDRLSGVGYVSGMSAETAELIRVCDALPAEKRQEVADFARFLLSRSDDEAWERLLDDPRPRPRLEAFLRDSATEGDAAMDAGRL